MLDNEKDNIIKNELQKDKYISKQANDVFQNFYSMNSYEASNQTEKINSNEIHIKGNNKMLFRWKALISVAASFVMVFSAGIAVYVNKDNSNQIASDEEMQIYTASIIGGKNAADYESIIVKNNEAIVTENDIRKISENDMVKAILTTDGEVDVQLKQSFISKYKLNLDVTKYYKVFGINKEIKNIFVGYIEKSDMPYVLLLTKNNTVEYIQIVDGNVSDKNKNTFEIYFYNKGQILGLENIVRFEQRKEYRYEDKLYYYIVAVSSTGVQKEIELGKYNDMSDGLEKKVGFSSPKDKRTYYVDKENYIQTSGWNSDYNGVYHIKNNDLYYIDLKNGGEHKLIEGVEKIWKNKNSNDGINNIVVELRKNNTILKEDNFLTLVGNTTSTATVVETKEDENMIAYLHEDGHVTIMFKSGGINRITKNSSGVIKENVKYDFSLKMFMNSNPEKSFKATTIYVGKIGAKGKQCLAIGTDENIVRMIDITKYLEETNLECFDLKSGFASAYLIDSIIPDDNTNKITSIEPVVEKIRLRDDNSVLECTTLKCNMENGTSKTYYSIALMLKEGFHDENGMGNMEVIE